MNTNGRNLKWQPIATAPQDGTAFVGRYVCADPHTGVLRYTKRLTWWGKTSHVPLTGWCWRRRGDVENTDLWEPTTWLPLETSDRTTLSRGGCRTVGALQPKTSAHQKAP